MASKQNHDLTFLIHTSEKHSDLEKKEQVLRRHQHAATVAHQRKGRRRIRSSPSMIVVDHITPHKLTPTTQVRTTERLSADAVGVEASLSSTPPPRPDPSGGLFDPFDVLRAYNQSGQAQMVFRSGMSILIRARIWTDL